MPLIDAGKERREDLQRRAEEHLAHAELHAEGAGRAHVDQVVERVGADAEQRRL
jgi:hypothetical protein